METNKTSIFHGEGNGNPLQCSCLENPKDSGAWWAAVYGVTKSRTWLATELNWVTLEVSDVSLSLCNDLGRLNLELISWSSFFTTFPAFSEWESLQFIMWMYLSWLIGIYTLEKSGWSPSTSPLLGRSHVVGWAGPAGVFELLGSCLTGKWDKRRPLTL